MERRKINKKKKKRRRRRKEIERERERERECENVREYERISSSSSLFFFVGLFFCDLFYCPISVLREVSPPPRWERRKSEGETYFLTSLGQEQAPLSCRVREI